MHNIFSILLQKRLNCTGNFQNHRLKDTSILKRLEMHNSIAKNQRKNIRGSFERQPQIYKIGKFLWKKKKYSVNFQENDNF